MTGQLTLFGPTHNFGDGHFSLHGIEAAGWTGLGQFYYDVRRWVAGEIELTGPKLAYMENNRNV